jgi:hypothetical protein
MGAVGDVIGAGTSAAQISSGKGGVQQDTNAANSAYGDQTKTLDYILTSIAPALANWNGLKPAELQQLNNTMANNTESMVKTVSSQAGGAANPGQLISRLGSSTEQTNLGLGTALGAAAQSQELQALESAGSLTAAAGAGFGQQGNAFMSYAQDNQNNVNNAWNNLTGDVTGIATSAATGGFSPSSMKGTGADMGNAGTGGW